MTRISFKICYKIMNFWGKRGSFLSHQFFSKMFIKKCEMFFCFSRNPKRRTVAAATPAECEALRRAISPRTNSFGFSAMGDAIRGASHQLLKQEVSEKSLNLSNFRSMCRQSRILHGYIFSIYVVFKKTFQIHNRQLVLLKFEIISHFKKSP